MASRRVPLWTMAAVVLVVGALFALGLSVHGGSRPSVVVKATGGGSVGTTAVPGAVVASPVAVAMALAENTYEAVLAPPTAEIPATLRASAPDALPDLSSAPPAPTLDPTGRHAYITATGQADITARATAAISDAFTGAYATQYEQTVQGVVSTLSSGQELLGGGGATVQKYLSATVQGANEVVVALVNQWSRIGSVGADTGEVRWQVNRNTVQVTDTLTKTAAGVWKVADRSWTYLPGNEP